MTSAMIDPGPNTGLGADPGAGWSADRLIGLAGKLWFAVALAGQWVFMAYIFAFYGVSTLTGRMQAWTRLDMVRMSYVRGDAAGNLVFAAHALAAGLVALAGALQLMPWIRRRAPAVHRWTGRAYLIAVMAAALAGLYLVWIRGDRPSPVGATSLSLNAVLMLVFAARAWRLARRGETAAHRRWALRTYIVANGQWFFRMGVIAWSLAWRGPVGIVDAAHGNLIYVMDFACYLVPLAVLEFYLRPRRNRTAGLALAGGLGLAAVVTGMGVFGYTALLADIFAGRI